MPIHKRYAEELIADLDAKLLGGLRESSDRLMRLLDEDDWSFVIKSHALVEAAVTEVILAKLGENVLRPIIERLPLANDEIGKVAVAKLLAVLSAEQRRFVRRLSQLRNALAHRPEFHDFTLLNYLASLDPNKRQVWKCQVTWFRDRTADDNIWLEAAETNPRMVLFFSVWLLLALLNIAAIEAEGPRKVEIAALLTAEDLYASRGALTSCMSPEAHTGTRP